ncbi:MAG TPA: biopolymer transporter ExbD [Phaeodactylibacter sp.]|nr:biopolymer transporter ExbD [Phaeodactylibacter sp.]
MALKRKSKISAEFSMSSLTDIIFLLLIFFMLTSSVVTPNALNLKMPGKSSAVTVNSKPDDVTIKRNGSFLLNGRKVSKSRLLGKLTTLRRKKKGKLDVTISPNKNAPTESVVFAMDALRKLGINGILAMEAD